MLSPVLIAAVGLVRQATAGYYGLSTQPYGCGFFLYPNATLDTSSPPKIIADALQEVDSILERLVDAYDMPGVSFGLVYDQQFIHYKGVGVTDYDTEDTPTEDTIYRIGSITKAFTDLLVLAWRDKNLLRTDDPLVKYNSHFTINNPWGITDDEKRGRHLTIEHLMAQVSGLPREAPCRWANSDLTWCDENTTTILERLANYDTMFPTDVQGSYSNLAYALLGNLIAEYYGSDYDTELYENILKPLGMDSSGQYLENNANKDNAATGYSDGEEQYWYDIGWIAPAGQMFSSVRDMTEWMKQFLGAVPGRYEMDIAAADSLEFSADTLREMLRPMAMFPTQEAGYGSPWEMQMLSGHYVRSKGGNINGFSSSVALIPELKLGAIAFVNSDQDGSLFTYTPLEALIPAFEGWLTAQDANFQPLYPKDPSIYAGTYTWEDGSWAFDVNLVEEDNGDWLVIEAFDYSKWRLVYVRTDDDEDIFTVLSTATQTDTCFYFALNANDGGMINFVRDGNGDVTEANLLQFYGDTFYRTEDTGAKKAKMLAKKGKRKSWVPPDSPFFHHKGKSARRG